MKVIPPWPSQVESQGRLLSHECSSVWSWVRLYEPRYSISPSLHSRWSTQFPSDVPYHLTICLACIPCIRNPLRKRRKNCVYTEACVGKLGPGLVSCYVPWLYFESPKAKRKGQRPVKETESFIDIYRFPSGPHEPWARSSNGVFFSTPWCQASRRFSLGIAPVILQPFSISSPRGDPVNCSDCRVHHWHLVSFI